MGRGDPWTESLSTALGGATPISTGWSSPPTIRSGRLSSRENPRRSGESSRRVEHIGSTAIPRIPAKPIIDILIGVEPSFDWSSLVDPIQSLGYLYWAENPRPDHMFFVKGMPPFGRRRTHHVHVRPPGEEFDDRIAFRDHLRKNPDTSERYAALKRRLASRFATDRDGYTAAKTDFVLEVLAESRIS